MATQDSAEIYIASIQSDPTTSMRSCISPFENSHLFTPSRYSPDSIRPVNSHSTRSHRLRISSLEDEALFSPLIPTLYSEPTYHGIIRKETAEKILMKQPRSNGAYLLYMDKCEINRVSICILYICKQLGQPHVLEGVLSFPKQTVSVRLDCTGDTFATIHGLIDYYSQFHIPVGSLSSAIGFSTSQHKVKLGRGVVKDKDLIRKLSPLDALLQIDIADDELMLECYSDTNPPYYTSNMEDAVRIRRYERENNENPDLPITIPRMVQSFVKLCPNSVVITWKEREVWEKITYLELFDASLQAAKALRRCGLRPGRGVGLFGGNSVYWIISNLGIIMAGGVSVAISPSISEERLKQIALKTRLQFMFVGDLGFFSRVQAVLDDLLVEHVVLFPPHVPSMDSGCVDWATFNSRGCGDNNDDIIRFMRQLKPNKCCTILFTSGTTGNPKGIMLSHDNISKHLKDSLKFYELKAKYGGSKNIRALNYYPLSVTLAHMHDIYINLMMKGTLYIVSPTPWQSHSLVKCLKEVRPTSIIAGENFWANLYRYMSLEVEKSGYWKQKLTTWAENLTEKQVTLESKNFRQRLFFSVVRTFFLEQIAKELGLEDCKICCSTYSPLPREVFEFMIKRNILILNIYGMTEATATVASTTTEDPKQLEGTIMSEIDYSIQVEPQDEPSNIGEICISGRNLFMGYVDEEQLTENAFIKLGADEMPYYRTGDLGQLDGCKLTYSGRKIHHIRMRDGERVFPIELEEKLLERLPFVEYAVVLPMKSRELIAVITVKVKYNDNGDRTRELDVFAANSCLYHLGINCILDVKGFMGHIQVREFITREIKQMNKDAQSQNHSIKTWAFAKEGFTIKTGELTQSLKVRRDIIYQRYIMNERVN